MSKKLIIVESPTKTKTISKVLGKDYQVLASKGHLRDLPKSQFGVDIENHFEPKYINVRGKAPLIHELKDASKKADMVYLATDPDREGEAIAWHLAQLLELDMDKLNRVTFNEITPKGVKEGMENPRTIDQDLVDSQQARRIMDRIVGYQISPLLWKKVKNGLSAGRVQSVALKLIVDREEEIRAFKPQEYWSVSALHNKNRINFSSDFKGRMKEGRLEKIPLSSEEEADQLISQLSDVFTVQSVSQTRRSKKPYPPFKTSTLQQEASRRLGFSTSKTMMVAQQLYEGVSIKGSGQVGLITYMRTDSTRMSQLFIQEARDFISKNYGSSYASSGISYGRRTAGSQDGHEGIRPTQVDRTPESIRQDLTPDQFRLYDLIWRRAVGAQMKAARYLASSIDLDSNGFLFRVTGEKPQFDGYQKVWPVKEQALLLPDLKEGEVLKTVKVDKKQHFTQPPARYSEASLVQALEKNEIGRPSTYASIIKNIQSRHYVSLQDRVFHPTELGETVNEFLGKNFSDIINVKFTAEMEKKLDEVADGQVEWRELMNDFYQVFSSDLQRAQEDSKSYKVADKKTGEKCPRCGGDLLIKHGRNGKFIGCSNFPSCSYTRSIVTKLGVKCPRCGSEVVEKISKRGKVFYGCSNYPKCDWASWDKPTGETCPLCGDLLLHKKNRKGERIYCNNPECPNHDKNLMEE